MTSAESDVNTVTTVGGITFKGEVNGSVELSFINDPSFIKEKSTL